MVRRTDWDCDILALVRAKMVILQAFNGTVALTALLLSAVVTEQNKTLGEIEEVCGRLTEALSRLAPDETPDQWPPSWPDERGHRRTDK